jgi:hypothetical protein
VIDDDPAFSPHIGDWKLNAVDWPNPKGPRVAQRHPCGPKVRVCPSGIHVAQPLRMYAAPAPKGPYVEQRSAPKIATGAQV